VDPGSFVELAANASVLPTTIAQVKEHRTGDREVDTEGDARGDHRVHQDASEPLTAGPCELQDEHHHVDRAGQKPAIGPAKPLNVLVWIWSSLNPRRFEIHVAAPPTVEPFAGGSSANVIGRRDAIPAPGRQKPHLAVGHDGPVHQVWLLGHTTGPTTTVRGHACEVLVCQDSAASMIFSSPSLTALTTAS